MKQSVNIYKGYIPFTSGLSKTTSKTIHSISPILVSDEFARVYKSDTNFGQNKVIASCMAFCANIYENLSKHFNFPTEAVPKRIRVYNQQDLIKPCSKFGFCIPDTKKVLKSEPPFELRSIFFEQHNLTPEDLDDIAETSFKQGLSSSSHFLSEFIHEWAHNVHLDLIYKKYGYEGLCPYGKKIYPNTNPRGLEVIKNLQHTKFSDKEKEIIADTISESVAEADPLELVAETLTKCICDSLDNGTLLPRKNPFEDLSSKPEFLEIFKRASML